MFFTKEKLSARLRELEPYRYRDAMRIASLGLDEDEAKEVGAYPPDGRSGNVIHLGGTWQGRDLYVWLSTKVHIPEEWDGKTVVGVFDFGMTGGGNNSGFESLLFVNREPFQGVDANHKEVFFPNDLIGRDVSLDFRLWSGLEGGGKQQEQEHRIKRAEVAWLDEAVDHLYYDAKAVLGAIEVLSESQPERVELLKALNDAFNRIDWSQPGSEGFYESIYMANGALSKTLSAMEKSSSVTIHALGHTHIDVAWLWRLKHTREKAARSFSTVLRLMEKYPEYIFLQTQPQLYDYLKNDYPELYETIKKRVRERRWEAGGGMWLEADCNIPSGESLVRQLLFGTRFFKNELGQDCNYLWLPDVFGYSWALPQILKKSGIDTFMTTKISWNQYNRMPHDTFKWRGIDGSEILTHFITTVEPWAEEGSWFYTYNGLITPKTVQKSWEAYRDKNLNRDLLMSYGYGDGGGGVNREMLEMIQRIDKMPGLPNVKTSRADDYFNSLHKNIDETDEYVHTWDGELYLEYHRGTYTSQAHNKKMNRQLELLYREAEWFGVLNMLVKKDSTFYPQATLSDGWKIILRNQFHDIIPGSSIHEVYEDSREEYEIAERLGMKVKHESLHSLVSTDEKALTVFNSAAWLRDGLIKVEDMDAENGSWVDAEGNTLSAQRTENGWLVKLDKLEPMSAGTVRFQPDTSDVKEVDPFTILKDGIDTPFYKIEWNSSGQLTRIYDVQEEREVLAENSRGNVLQIFEDKPMAFDAWDIDIFYQEKGTEVSELNLVETVEIGPLCAVIRFAWHVGRSEITQDMIVYADDRRIDFKTEVDWNERQRLLKAAFPVNVRATEATYDIQYGNVKRPTHWNTSWDMARFETVGHQWADLSEAGYGISLLNNCKYGYDIKDNVMRLSLLKGAIHPDPEADHGHHSFTYSLYPHPDDWREGKTVQAAWDLNQPLTSQKGSYSAENPVFLRPSADHIMIDAVKKAEDGSGVVVRLHEFEGRRGEVVMSSDLNITGWCECDLMENEVDKRQASHDIRFAIKPYEIKTLMIDFTIMG